MHAAKKQWNRPAVRQIGLADVCEKVRAALELLESDGERTRECEMLRAALKEIDEEAKA